MFKHNIPIDSVQTIINQYNLKEKEGVGMVVIVECFEKAKESVSAYYVFFDIATKHVLMNTFKFVKSAGGTGLANHWGKGLGYAFNTYLYYDYSKFYRKAKKTIKSDAIQ